MSKSQTQVQTSKEILNMIVKEYGVEAKSLTKGLVELVQLVNKMLKGTGITYRPFSTVDDVPRVCWWEGTVRRCKWYEPMVKDGELVLRCNVTYSGEPDWYQDYETTVNGLAKERRYSVIKGIAIWTMKLLKLLTRKLEKQRDELSMMNSDISKLINALKGGE